MKNLFPDYYKNFKCIAGDCPKTCCAGWQIEIDEDSIARYKSMGLTSVDYENELFNYDENKRCVNLREDGLCQLIMQHGENILCRTCATFPRHIEEFENVREYSLSISCPEVARIILNRKDTVGFYTNDDDLTDDEDYDSQEQAVYGFLKQLRAKFFEVAQNRNLSLKDRAGLILCIADAFQNEYDFIALEDGSLEDLDIQAVLDTDYSSLHLPLANRKMIFDVMKNWEFTGDEFEEILKETEDTLYNEKKVTSSAQELSKYKAKMCKHLEDQNIDFPVILEQILVYFIYAYFCGSAYDEYYFGQAQLAVCTCLHIQDLALAHFINKGSLSLDDIIRFTYLYARELEHSIPNILYTEEYMDEHPLV